MHLVENWQRPASDDINPDALEYLFGQKKLGRATPWVEMAGDPEPVVRITPEYIRLQTRVEILKATIELTSEQLHEAHHKIGMLAAELARRDLVLKELSEYRAKAAMAVAYGRHNELLQLQITGLKNELAKEQAKLRTAASDHFLSGGDKPLPYTTTASAVISAAAAVVSARELQTITAENYRTVNAKDFSFPFLLLNSLLTLGFATAVLITILH